MNKQPNRDIESHASVAERTDAIIERLVQDAGVREMPSATIESGSFVVVQAAWQDAVQQRQKAKRVTYFAVAATVLIAVGATFAWQKYAQAPSFVASVAELKGAAQKNRDNEVVAIEANARLTVGDELQTMPGGKVLLHRDSGLSVIVGPATRIVWESRDELRLLAGVLYVDTGVNETLAAGNDNQVTRDAFTVLTHAGRITHIGTQFSVDARDSEVRVAVRSGAVLLQTHNRESQIARGDNVRLTLDGTLVRERLPSTADHTSGPWDWLALSNPQFAIENRSLFDVMRDMSAASGMELHFASQAIETQTRSLVLHGPPLKLAPLAALDAVLLTTQLQANRQTNRVQIDERVY